MFVVRPGRLIVAALLVAAPLTALACSSFDADRSACAECDASIEGGSGDTANVDRATADAKPDATVEDGNPQPPDAGALCAPKVGEPTLLCLTFDEPGASVPSVGLVALALNADAGAVSVGTAASSSPPNALHITMLQAAGGPVITGVSATTTPTTLKTKSIRLRFDLRFTGGAGFTPVSLYFKRNLGPPAYLEIVSDSPSGPPNRLHAFGLNDAGVQVRLADLGVPGLTPSAWHQVELSVGFTTAAAPTVTVTIDGKATSPGTLDDTFATGSPLELGLGVLAATGPFAAFDVFVDNVILTTKE